MVRVIPDRIFDRLCRCRRIVVRRSAVLRHLSKYMKIDVTYSKEKIDQYTEVEKLTITLPGTFDPDESRGCVCQRTVS